ncbi:hypothetical protein BCR43DRAFT_491328 [Syncephalastrum racemosum]|uniref:Bromo domain-containing protein n=1 Tax=Syncephalastrum racemosum TaxID=13706 RepID=A0A1X2HBS4_SYNRA|nr:hypothetical protein BCR43DRAFT_491328 [Syncephalastrum racemosum]
MEKSEVDRNEGIPTSDDDHVAYPAESNATSSSSSAPRIKLKLRLNPSASSAHNAGSQDNMDPEDDADHKRKKKHKKKKSHKKHKKDNQRRESEQLNIDDEEDNNSNNHHHHASHNHTRHSHANHVPVGGKRPFAMIKADEADDFDEASSMDGGSISTTSRRESVLPDTFTEADTEDDDTSHFGDTPKDQRWDEHQAAVHPADAGSHLPRPSQTHSHTSQKKDQQQPQQKPKKRGRPAKNKAPPKPEPKAPEPVRKDLKTICIRLLDTLEKRDAYGFFLQPVDTSVVQDYLTVIKHPMDFSTMRKKLERGEYHHMDDFLSDFTLIMTNAKTYNAPNTIYYRNADRLQQYGVKAIERAAKTIVYTPEPEERPVTPIKQEINWSRRASSATAASRKDSGVKYEEEVDILGLDTQHVLAPRKQSRADTELTLDALSSRGGTPTRGYVKKKKKKMTEAGVAYSSDGSLLAVGGVNDLTSLIPFDDHFAHPPQITTANINALPSAFFTNRSTFDDWAANKHYIHPAHFCDYGAYTALGPQSPGAYYTAQDACYIYPLYGDDRGEAYMRSIWEFVQDTGLTERTDRTSQHLTHGAWEVLKLVLQDPQEPKKIETEFGPVQVEPAPQEPQQQPSQPPQMPPQLLQPTVAPSPNQGQTQAQLQLPPQSQPQAQSQPSPQPESQSQSHSQSQSQSQPQLQPQPSPSE